MASQETGRCVKVVVTDATRELRLHFLLVAQDGRKFVLYTSAGTAKLYLYALQADMVGTTAVLEAGSRIDSLVYDIAVDLFPTPAWSIKFLEGSWLRCRPDGVITLDTDEGLIVLELQSLEGYVAYFNANDRLLCLLREEDATHTSGLYYTCQAASH